MNKSNKFYFKIIKYVFYLMFFFIICLLINSFFKQSLFTENFGNPVSCHYYYMEQCGHCKRFSPEWDQFVQTYNGPVKLRKYEMNEAESDLEKYKIQGFPTILIIDENGEAKDYDGPRTSDALNKFISNL